MPNEMQELIEAAEAMLKVGYIEGSGWDIGIRLSNAISVARAYEGGWIPVNDETPIGAPLLIVYQGVVQHLTYTLLEDGWYPHDTDYEYCCPIEHGELVTHYLRLPSPPLSVETPKVHK